MFDHEGPAVVSAMRNLTVGVSDHLEITSPMEVDQMVAYTHIILKGAEVKKYRQVMVGYMRSAKELAGDEWNLGELADLSANYFQTWVKTDTTGYDGHAHTNRDK